MTLTIRTIVAVAATSLVAVNSGLAQTRGVTAEDYYAFETLSDPHFSPDGSTIAYTVTFDKFDVYWNASPLKYVKNVRTPTLVLHSDNDYRVPIEQGEQWFRALRHYGVNAEFVIFPRENHNLTRTGEPKHLVESLNWQAYWFDRFLNGNENAKPPDAL